MHSGGLINGNRHLSIWPHKGKESEIPLDSLVFATLFFFFFFINKRKVFIKGKNLKGPYYIRKQKLGGHYKNSKGPRTNCEETTEQEHWKLYWHQA